MGYEKEMSIRHQIAKGGSWPLRWNNVVPHPLLFLFWYVGSNYWHGSHYTVLSFLNFLWHTLVGTSAATAHSTSLKIFHRSTVQPKSQLFQMAISRLTSVAVAVSLFLIYSPGSWPGREVPKQYMSKSLEVWSGRLTPASLPAQTLLAQKVPC